MKQIDRSIVGLDTQLLIHAYRERNITPEQKINHEKARALIGKLVRNGVNMCISAITLSEYLAGVPAEMHGAKFNDLDASFTFAPFNARASIIAATMVPFAKTLVNGDRQVVLADTKIVASLIANNCRRFETLDVKLIAIAKQAGMRVNTINAQMELPLDDI